MIDVYTSYAWEADSEAVLAKLEKAFELENLNLIYDKKSTKFKSDIKAFMDEIGHAQYIVVIISDKYLRSHNCMYELLVIYESGDFEKRIYPIVLPGAKIYDTTDIIDYKKYWDDKINAIDEKLNGQSLSNINDLLDESNKYVKIRSLIIRLIAILKNTNTLNIKKHEDSNFNHIIGKIKEDNIKTISTHKNINLQNIDAHKFIQEKIAEINIYESLFPWLKKNQKKLIDEIAVELMKNKDKYSRRGLDSKKSLSIFKKSITEHFEWMIYCLEYATDRELLSNHVKTLTYTHIIPDAYKDFFILMQDKLKDPHAIIKPKFDEIPPLIILTDKLIEHYS
jgi:hypothetical protein